MLTVAKPCKQESMWACLIGTILAFFLLLGLEGAHCTYPNRCQVWDKDICQDNYKCCQDADIWGSRELSGSKGTPCNQQPSDRSPLPGDAAARAPVGRYDEGKRQTGRTEWKEAGSRHVRLEIGLQEKTTHIRTAKPKTLVSPYAFITKSAHNSRSSEIRANFAKDGSCSACIPTDTCVKDHLQS
ncbi:hypothetical protein GOODEAATRI_000583 [Goodea atripinnis]|uniref:Uncharacterized protein n=1 Tax=Goodea atripinnis TaxID=208336 RepID=A0ABV0N7Q6_9TELE